ncbi:tetratricopeptide (TPR) repeat protein [Virgibacillus natechei]|uniref:Tetratricopeptide (TPR) repeat protein n=1 Tax=Virgibacillus natechei TaxID=1216297 RepID=A0ABS4IHW1_9BACI|nr:tetratricopeptide repeat protein [Virgibacillus natechei]MBP1970533.1 tetratricopeptide (TPR) repeat protein [Virgibacillus natechei]UZD14064.1 tetratricopeptide repeat protein [Virgibacillus natechei]
MSSKARKRIENEEFEKAQEILLQLLNENPDEAEANHLFAETFDAQGFEREAIPYYENALANNIEGELREAVFIQLGSSYRCIGEYEKAKEILLKGLEEFPDNLALKAFLAMALYNLSEEEDAVTMLLQMIAESSDDPWLKKYQRAIKFYAVNLNETW